MDELAVKLAVPAATRQRDLPGRVSRSFARTRGRKVNPDIGAHFSGRHHANVGVQHTLRLTHNIFPESLERREFQVGDREKVETDANRRSARNDVDVSFADFRSSLDLHEGGNFRARGRFLLETCSPTFVSPCASS